MKSLILLIVLLPTATSFLGAQSSAPGEIRVHVLPVVNRSDQAQFDAVATTVTGTVSLTLRLLGDYEISQGEPAEPTAQDEAPPPGPGATEHRPLPTDPLARREALAALAEELSVENLVFGEVLP